MYDKHNMEDNGRCVRKSFRTRDDIYCANHVTVLIKQIHILTIPIFTSEKLKKSITFPCT